MGPAIKQGFRRVTALTLQDLVEVPVVFAMLEAREGVRASAPPGVTLPGLAKRKAFRNSRGHGLATVVPRSVSVFLLGKTSVDPQLLRRSQRSPLPRPGLTHTKARRARRVKDPRHVAWGCSDTCGQGREI